MNTSSFTNAAIEEENLPRAEDLDFEGLAESYARTMIIEGIASVALGFIILFIASNIEEEMGFLIGQWWFYAAFLVPVALTLIMSPLIAKSRGFALREKDIHYKSGIIWRKHVSLPFNRVQHVELESGPLERFFNLTTLKFFTAGGGHADMKIPALTKERATKLRAYVIDKTATEKLEQAHHDDV